MPLDEASLIFGTSFLVGLSGAVSPGPLLALDIRESVQRGFWAGPSISLGHAMLELVVVVLLALGISRFLQVETAATVIALLGGSVLLWMGWGMLRQPGRGAPSTTLRSHHSTGHLRPGGPILGGVLVSLSNPFWTIWWFTVGASFLSRSIEMGLGALGIGAFYLGHILSDFSWFSAVSLAVASGRRLMTDAVYKAIVVVCGLFLWALAGYFVASGVSNLL